MNAYGAACAKFVTIINLERFDSFVFAEVKGIHNEIGVFRIVDVSIDVDVNKANQESFASVFRFKGFNFAKLLFEYFFFGKILRSVIEIAS